MDLWFKNDEMNERILWLENGSKETPIVQVIVEEKLEMNGGSNSK